MSDISTEDYARLKEEVNFLRNIILIGWGNKPGLLIRMDRQEQQSKLVSLAINVGVAIIAGVVVRLLS